ncbi:MAG TPA: SH3 domain-containing protein [Candidatus Saccharimonadales bacterium]|nr:SH3 domain-containing protein [Candidatus Saccharimonadales bacterium]
MQIQTSKQSVLDIFVLVLFICLLAGGVTYLEVVRPSIKDLDGLMNRLTAMQTPAPAAPPVQTKPKAAPASASVIKTASTNQTVHFRTAKDTSSQIIQDLAPGTTVQLRDDSDAKWQGVSYQGKQGYIFKEYLSY